MTGAMPGRPVGYTLHGSRSTVRKTTRQEFDGTRAYAASKPRFPDGSGGTYTLGWNATVGDRMYSIHMKPSQWGWNAGESSYIRIGLELAQWDISAEISDDQVAGILAYHRAEVVPVYGEYDFDDPSVLKAHTELPQGIRDHKSDVFLPADPRLEELKRRIRKAA